MKKRAGKTALAVLLAGMMVTTTVYAEPGDVDALRQKKEEADSEVNALQERLLGLIAEMDQLEADMIQKGQEVEQATQELTAAQEKEQKQYADMKLRIKYMYEEGDTTFLEKLLSAESITDLLNQADYIQKVHTYDRNMLEEYVKIKEEVDRLKTARETELTEMENLRAEYTSQQANLNAELTAAEEKSAGFGEQLQAALEAEAARKAAEEAAKAAAEAAKNEQQNQTTNRPSGTTPSEGSGNQEPDTPSAPSDNNSNSNYNPPVSNGSGQAVANYACNFIGNPYVWAGTSLTNGCDCSGFVMSVYAHFGVYLPHSSGNLRSSGYGVSYSQAQPGDIMCYSGHVGIYIGGGQIVNAIDEAHGIGISSATYAPILAVRRIF